MKYDVTKTKWVNLRTCLRSAGFKVKIISLKGDEFGKKSIRMAIDGYGVRAMADHPNNEYMHPNISHRVSVENDKAFDKWTRCPLYSAFPVNDYETQLLVRRMKYWGSDEGEADSNCNF